MFERSIFGQTLMHFCIFANLTDVSKVDQVLIKT